jgi:hypothetical protein
VATPKDDSTKGHDGDERAMVTPKNAELGSNPKSPWAEASSGHDVEGTKLTINPHNTKGVGHGEICDLLIEWLQDVTVHSFYIFV